MISVVTASTLVAYIFYCISPETIQKFGTDMLGLTIPFPLYGIFRYLYLVHQREGGGSPSQMLLNDRPLLAVRGALGDRGGGDCLPQAVWSLICRPSSPSDPTRWTSSRS